jgi:antitoxin component YwqK of YwqJK toxin-antitoxin module
VTLHYEDGTVAYKGDMFYGLKNGLGSASYPNGNLQYEGYWRQDLRHCNVDSADNKNFGVCTSYYKSGALKYQGGFCANKKNGFGRLYKINGELHKEGVWFADI